jgi:AraC-like DNA-binding protein
MENQQRQFVLSLLAYAALRDISITTLCRNANVNLASLKKDDAYVLSSRQFDDLWFYASQRSNDPLFGLHFGESLQLSALGVVGEIIKSSRTVGEAVQLAASLTHLVTNLFGMETMKSKKNFIIRLVPRKKDENDFTLKQMRDFLLVFVVHELDGFLLEKIRPSSLFLPNDISSVNEYERVLRCKPTRKKGEIVFHFDIKYWDEPIISANYELQKILLEKVSSIPKKGLERFSERVVQHLMANAYLGIRSLEDVATNFNMAPRSLQRRLQEENITFHQLADSVRKSLALHYIELGEHPIKAISNMLGYNELSAFSRAFKRWTGKAPANYLS